jgi:hypothetical protein
MGQISPMDVVLVSVDYVYGEFQGYVRAETGPRFWGEAHTYRSRPQGSLRPGLWITSAGPELGLCVRSRVRPGGRPVRPENN